MSSSDKHVQFNLNSNSLNDNSTLLTERNKFIENIILTIHCLYLPVNIILNTFNEYKANYINWLQKHHYSSLFIEQEITECLIIIMRRLYFEK